jgi:5'-3' exonuclease
MTTYLLVDTANTFFRARHAAHRAADQWTRLGFAMHITMSAVNRSWRIAEADHVVFALEGRSWRKDFYEPYKKNRKVKYEALTEAEQEEDKLFWETYDELTAFLKDNSNCSVLRCEIAEADDIIARWIDMHPGDDHVIVSSDTDFVQLVNKNVRQYNGIQNHMITLEGIFDDYGKPVKDKKTGEAKASPDPEWLLFEKCMRGDTTDNVFSAYPGVRKKGTKNKVGLLEAFEDRASKGYNWNNMMLQRWTDHNGEEHRVLDDYERNRTLIDLTAQPAELKEYIDTSMHGQMDTKTNKMVGAKFLKFCGKYELNRIAEDVTKYAEWLQKGYHVTGNINS